MGLQNVMKKYVKTVELVYIMEEHLRKIFLLKTRRTNYFQFCVKFLDVFAKTVGLGPCARKDTTLAIEIAANALLIPHVCL